MLVNLAKGLLGPEASALLGALVLSQFWQATLGRPPSTQAAVIRSSSTSTSSPTTCSWAPTGRCPGKASGLGVGLVWPTSSFTSWTQPCARPCWPTPAPESVSSWLLKTPESWQQVETTRAEDFTSLAASSATCSCGRGGGPAVVQCSHACPGANQLGSLHPSSLGRYLRRPRGRDRSGVPGVGVGKASCRCRRLAPRRRGGTAMILRTRPIACPIDRSCRVVEEARTSWWSLSPHAPRARTVLSLTVPCSPPVGMEVGIPICADARLLLADRVRQAGWSSGWLARGDASHGGGAVMGS